MSVTFNKKPMAAERQIAITSCNESKKVTCCFKSGRESGKAFELNEKVTIEVPPDQSVFSASLTLEDNDHKPLPFGWEIAELCLPHGEISAIIKAGNGFMDVRHLEQDGRIIFLPPYGGPEPSPPTTPPPKGNKNSCCEVENQLWAKRSKFLR